MRQPDFSLKDPNNLPTYDEMLVYEMEECCKWLHTVKAVTVNPVLVTDLLSFANEVKVLTWKKWFMDKIKPVIKARGIDSCCRQMLSEYGLFPSLFTAYELGKFQQYISKFNMLIREVIPAGKRDLEEDTEESETNKKPRPNQEHSNSLKRDVGEDEENLVSKRKKTKLS
jgi:hypothetical protein